MHLWAVGTNAWKLIHNLLSDTQRGDKICFIVTSLPRQSSRWRQQNLQMSAPDRLQQLLFGHKQDWMGLIPGRTWSRTSSWSMQGFQVSSTTSSILHFYLEHFLQDLSISEDFCCRHKLSHLLARPNDSYMSAFSTNSLLFKCRYNLFTSSVIWKCCFYYIRCQKF